VPTSLTATMTKYFSGQDVLRIAEQVVSEFGPEYVYQNIGTDRGKGNGCFYVVDGQPSCLVGQIAYRMGASVEWLNQMETSEAAVLCGYTPNWFQGNLPDNPYFTVSRNTAMALNSAQAAQDGGSPWGVALERLRGQLSE
jgi:hypothetical protein